jgi:hypothetical protein
MTSDNTVEVSIEPTINVDTEEGLLVDVDDASMASDETPSVTETSIGKKETKAVTIFRIILVIVLTTSALTVSLMAFFSAKADEQGDFEDAFAGHARKVRSEQNRTWDVACGWWLSQLHI